MEETPTGTDPATNFERLRIVAVMDCLSETTSFDKLTVIDVCRQAKISRTTFYRLFEDKYAAVNWYVNVVSRIGHVECGRTLSWHDASVVTLSGFLMMRSLLMSTKVCTGYDSSENTGIRLRTSSLIETLTRHRGVTVDRELAFQVKFFARSEVPLVREWYEEADSVPVEEMATTIESCVPRRLHDLVALPDDPAKGVPLTYGRLVTLL